MKKKNSSGFSLVELAIVLVIIGLITGGILTGQDLIRASELNSVVSDVNKYKTAVNTFKLKYNALPGDIDNATSYWSTSGNGNKDGNITWSGESMRAWQHLALAGLIPGSYTGLIGTGGLPDTNIPAASITPGGFCIYEGDDNGNGNNASPTRFVFGAPTASASSGALLTAAEGNSIDSKIDDGLPRNGTVFGVTGASASGVCYSGTAYSLSNTGVSCFLMFEYQK